MRNGTEKLQLSMWLSAVPLYLKVVTSSGDAEVYFLCYTCTGMLRLPSGSGMHELPLCTLWAGLAFPA